MCINITNMQAVKAVFDTIKSPRTTPIYLYGYYGLLIWDMGAPTLAPMNLMMGAKIQNGFHGYGDETVGLPNDLCGIMMQLLAGERLIKSL